MKMFIPEFVCQVLNVYSWSKEVSVTFQGWKNINFGKCKGFVTISKKHVRHISEKFIYELTLGFMMCKPTALPNTCYSPEDHTEFAKVEENIRNNIQPTSSQKCTVLLFHNLAQPEWVSVKCTHPVLGHVACISERMSQNASSQVNQSAALYQCFKHEILFQNNCYILIWHSLNLLFDQHSGTPCSSRKHKYCVLTSTENTIFHRIITSTSLQFLDAASVEHQNSTIFFSVVKQMPKVTTIHSTRTKGFLGCYRRRTETNSKSVSGLVLSCPDGSFTSSAFVCQDPAIRMCRVSPGSDVVKIICNKTHKTASQCSPVLYKDKQGNCRSFVPQKNKQNLPSDTRHKFSCSDISSSSSALVNDLIPDCENGSDESILMQVLLGKNIYDCFSSNQLPCLVGHSRCYNISDICIHKLNKHNLLTPCRTGSHMTNCREFQCHAHFKCPSQYCILWKCIGDGKWDCPKGYDEKIVQFSIHFCTGKFKCHKSHICLPVVNVCDKHPDCIWADDEFLCELQNVVCPKHCLCVNFAVSCVNLSKVSFGFHRTPYSSFHIIHCHLVSFSDFAFENTVIANFSHNSLSDMSGTFHDLSQLVSVDVSDNSICIVETKSFTNLPKLHFIYMRNNSVSAVHSCAIAKIQFLLLLDLKENNLTFFGGNIFVNVSGIGILSLLDNPLVEVDLKANIVLCLGLLFADSFKLCIKRPTESICIGYMPWLSTDQELLVSVSLKALFGVIFSLASLSNIFAIAWSKRQKKPETRQMNLSKKPPKNAPGVIMKTIFGANILCISHLLILVSADAHYGSTFLLKEGIWRVSAPCTTAFSFLLLCSLLLPTLLCFLCFARMEVTLKPFDAKCKSSNFTAKTTLVICLFMIIITVSSSLLFGLLKRNTSNLCSPFVDPTQNQVETNILVTGTLSIQITAILFILISSVLLLRNKNASQKSALGHSAVTISFCIKLFLPPLSPFFSWLPCSIIFLTLLHMSFQTSHLPHYTTGLNCLGSVLLPILFSVTVKRT